MGFEIGNNSIEKLVGVSELELPRPWAIGKVLMRSVPCFFALIRYTIFAAP